MKNITHSYFRIFLLNLILLGGIHLDVSAQGWERYYEVDGEDFGRSITETSDGQLMVASLGRVDLVDVDISISKISTEGDLLWSKTFSKPGNREFCTKIIATADGGYLIGGYAEIASSTAFHSYLLKVDEDGEVEWELYPENVLNAPGEIKDVIEASNGDFIFTGFEDLLSDHISLGRVSPDGTLQWMQSYQQNATNSDEAGWSLIEDNNGDILVTGDRASAAHLLMKTDADGTYIWKDVVDFIRGGRFLNLEANGDIRTIGFRTIASGTINQFDADAIWIASQNVDAGIITLTIAANKCADGGYLVTGLTQQGNSVLPYVLKLNNSGAEEWIQTFSNEIDLDHVIEASSGDIYATGRHIINDQELFVVKLDQYGRLYSNIINSQIAFDTTLNCEIDPGEIGLANWVVEAVKNNAQSFYAVTDTMGGYEITVDTGNYIVTAYPPNQLWSICTNDVPLSFTNFYDTLQVNFAAQSEMECPQMSVDLATLGLRRCFESEYIVHYCNDGTMTGEDAFVNITLDPFLSFVSSTIPAIDLGDNIYQFELGDVPIAVCDNFKITVDVDCDSTTLGQTHCTEAHIFPDTLCLPINNDWSGAFVEVDAVCDNDTIRFEIENTGTGPMDNPLNYVIIEDAILLMTQPFDLEPGEIANIPIGTDGSTYTIYAQQEPDAPGNGLPIISVEGCVVNPLDPFSIGFVNQFPLNDGLPAVDIDCRPNSGSYDPNDKQGFPIGYDEEHFIEANTDLEYMIRFQNTGTDTAFTVVVKDTLSPLLNARTIKAGASSHAYEYSLTGDGVLTFTFNNIELPDSNVNQIGSNGFVKFKIEQLADLPIDTRIENSAAIFFDFNDPIITNTTFHTIAQPWITMIFDSNENISSQQEALRVYPNPMTGIAYFEFENVRLDNGNLELFNTNGQLLKVINFYGKKVEFDRGNLPVGIYFFKIKESNDLISTGKIIVQ